VDSTATPGGVYDYWVGLTEADGTVTISGSARVTLLSGVPAVFALAPSRPNPFERRTSIAFDVPASGGRVSLQVFDLTGRRIRNLVDEHFAAGRFAVTWDGVDEQGRRVAPGVYFYRMTAPGYQETRRLIVVR